MRSSVPRQTKGPRKSTTTFWPTHSSSMNVAPLIPLTQPSPRAVTALGFTRRQTIVILHTQLYQVKDCDMTPLREQIVTRPEDLGECLAHLAACRQFGF